MKKNKLILPLIFLSTLASFFLLIEVLIFIQNEYIKSIILRFIKGLYNPHTNIFLVNKIASINLNIYFYLLIPVSTGTMFFLLKFFQFKKNITDKVFQNIYLSVFFIFISLQMISQWNIFQKEISQYHNRTLHEINLLRFGKIYRFTQYLKKIRPGAHKAKLLTDVNLNQDPGMYGHRVLAYHLYPIDIRIKKGEVDTLIFFNKKDFKKNVPQNFQIIENFNDNIGLAIRKDKLQ